MSSLEANPEVTTPPKPAVAQPALAQPTAAQPAAAQPAAAQPAVAQSGAAQPAAAGSAGERWDLFEGAPVALGGPRGMQVVRTLPNKHRRMVGAWCFLDAYGPHDLAGTPGMRVGPHPHIGLQTVTWLVRGEVLHRDSLGSLQEIRPGQLNLMTAGRGISHSEETPAEHSPVLEGVQLWVALPDSDRHTAPTFAHHDDLPVLTDGGLTATVLMGELAGVTSPARAYTPLLGAELTLTPGTVTEIPLRPDFEHAVLLLEGTATVAGTPVSAGPLLYLGEGRRTLRLEAPARPSSGPPASSRSPAGTGSWSPARPTSEPPAGSASGSSADSRPGSAPPVRLMLLGGEPFDERLTMWWNYVARDHDEIVEARRAWEDAATSPSTRFGEVHGYPGSRIPAPPMPITRLVARPRAR